MNKNKSLWDSKPYWCQPWSIISFGVFVIVFIWKIVDNLIITSIVSIIIFAWWIIFLILAPKSYQLNFDKNKY